MMALRANRYSGIDIDIDINNRYSGVLQVGFPAVSSASAWPPVWAFSGANYVMSRSELMVQSEETINYCFSVEPII